MNLDLSQKYLNQILLENTSILIADHFQYNKLKKASDTLFDLFEKISHLNVTEREHNDPIYLDSGKAIGTYWAGRCMTELIRTRKFLWEYVTALRPYKTDFQTKSYNVMQHNTKKNRIKSYTLLENKLVFNYKFGEHP